MRLVLPVEILVFPVQSDGFFPSYPLFCVEFIESIGIWMGSLVRLLLAVPFPLAASLSLGFSCSLCRTAF
jgi:hypothetical protein